MARSILRSLILFAVLASALADDTEKKPLGGFVPKRLPAYVGLVLYATSALVHWILFFRHGRPRFMLVLTAGMTSGLHFFICITVFDALPEAMAAGFAMRLVFAGSPHSVGLYIVMDLLILLSPCAYLATDYMILARLTTTFDDEVAQSCLLIRRERITKLFVLSDVVTFILQASGGAQSTSTSASAANTGKSTTMVGLVLQLLSFGLFTVVLGLFGHRLRTRFPEVWCPPLKSTSKPFTPWGTHAVDDWRILYLDALLHIRSFFRIAEFAGGFDGYIATHEFFFYLFDALPLWLAMSLYCVVWPTRFLHPHASASTSAEAIRMKGIPGVGGV
ncbi:RTA1 like protein-domain-containing protein [Mycena latifolia]|nr:RTA1 like protein-domain-containing protein [Mycena latifolia]